MFAHQRSLPGTQRLTVVVRVNRRVNNQSRSGVSFFFFFFFFILRRIGKRFLNASFFAIDTHCALSDVNQPITIFPHCQLRCTAFIFVFYLLQKFDWTPPVSHARMMTTTRYFFTLVFGPLAVPFCAVSNSIVRVRAVPERLAKKLAQHAGQIIMCMMYLRGVR